MSVFVELNCAEMTDTYRRGTLSPVEVALPMPRVPGLV